MPIAGVVTLSARRRSVAAMGFGALLLLTTAVVLTRSRAAWLAGFVMLVMLGLGAWRAVRAGAIGRARAGLVAAGLAAGALAAMLLPNRLDWRSGSPYRDSIAGLVNYQEGSGRGRLIQYGNSLRLVLHDPLFGTGRQLDGQVPAGDPAGRSSFSGADDSTNRPVATGSPTLTERGVAWCYSRWRGWRSWCRSGGSATRGTRPTPWRPWGFSLRPS
jgi:hypothetical protein